MNRLCHDESFSAFFPSSRQDPASTGRGHPAAEAMVVFPPALAGLKRHFHGALLCV
jgi:hypothetical protein